jgi:hypothetical protein
MCDGDIVLRIDIANARTHSLVFGSSCSRSRSRSRSFRSRSLRSRRSHCSKRSHLLILEALAHTHFARDVLTARDVLLCSFWKLSLMLSLSFSLTAHFARDVLTSPSLILEALAHAHAHAHFARDVLLC